MPPGKLKARKVAVCTRVHRQYARDGAPCPSPTDADVVRVRDFARNAVRLKGLGGPVIIAVCVYVCDVEKGWEVR